MRVGDAGPGNYKKGWPLCRELTAETCAPVTGRTATHRRCSNSPRGL